MQTSRYYLKHTAEPFVYAVEADDEGTILNALDVSDEHEQGGLCPHMLASLPLAARIDDVERLNRDRSDFEPFTPECPARPSPDGRLTRGRTPLSPGRSDVSRGGCGTQGAPEAHGGRGRPGPCPLADDSGSAVPPALRGHARGVVTGETCEMTMLGEER